MQELKDGIKIDDGTADFMLATIRDWKKQNEWICKHGRRQELSELPHLSGNFYDAVCKDFERLIYAVRNQAVKPLEDAFMKLKAKNLTPEEEAEAQKGLDLLYSDEE